MMITYKIGEKEYRIPKKEIEKLERILDLTREDAILTYLEDEGILSNEEQEELCSKAKENKVTSKVHSAKSTKDKPKTQKERTQKENPVKEMIIAEIAKVLPTINAENIVVENKGKIITFSIGENEYKIDLVQKRTKKN